MPNKFVRYPSLPEPVCKNPTNVKKFRLMKKFSFRHKKVWCQVVNWLTLRSCFFYEIIVKFSITEHIQLSSRNLFIYDFPNGDWKSEFQKAQFHNYGILNLGKWDTYVCSAQRWFLSQIWFCKNDPVASYSKGYALQPKWSSKWSMEVQNWSGYIWVFLLDLI